MWQLWLSTKGGGAGTRGVVKRQTLAASVVVVVVVTVLAKSTLKPWDKGLPTAPVLWRCA